MARGNLAKEEITKRILNTFNQSFLYGKEIRIPILENGEVVQIKVTLVAAKTNVENGADNAVPSSVTPVTPAPSVEITEDEKREVADLLASLNL